MVSSATGAQHNRIPAARRTSCHLMAERESLAESVSWLSTHVHDDKPRSSPMQRNCLGTGRGEHKRKSHKPLSKGEVRALRSHTIRRCVVKIKPPMKAVKGCDQFRDSPKDEERATMVAADDMAA